MHAINNIGNHEQQDVLHAFDKSSDDATDDSNSDYETASEMENCETENLAEKFSKLTCHPTDLEVQGEDENKEVVDNILVPVHTVTSEQSDEESTEEEDDDDDDAWITPSKFHFINKVVFAR